MSLRQLAIARQMYVCGFALPHIASVFQVTTATLRAYAKQYAFAEARDAYQFRLGAMKRTIIASFLAQKAGKKPRIAASQALAYAQAYAKLSDKKVEAHHLYHAFELLSDALIASAEAAPSARRQQSALRLLKGLRALMEDVLSKTLQKAQLEP